MTISLQWQPSDSASGYYLEWGSYPGQHVIDEGPATSGSAEINPWGTWYFSVAAYDGDDLSGPSNEVVLTFQQMGAAKSGADFVLSSASAVPKSPFTIWETVDFTNWNIVAVVTPETSVFYWTDANAITQKRTRYYVGASGK